MFLLARLHICETVMQLFQHSTTLDKGHVCTAHNTQNEDINTNYIN